MGQSADRQGLEVLTLALDDEVFAIDAGMVREILDLVQVTRVPSAPAFVGGLINVRGKVVPLADLRLKFGMERRPSTVDTRIVVIDLDLGGECTTVGLLADKVYEVTEIASTAIEAAPEIGTKWRPEFIKGIGKRGHDFIVIPDIEQVFASA